MQHFIKQIYVKEKYPADTDTSHRVLRFHPPPLFFKVTTSFQVNHTVPGGLRLVLFCEESCKSSFN